MAHPNDPRFNEPSKPCPDCEGKGEIEIDRDNSDGVAIWRMDKCETCDGTGKVAEDHEEEYEPEEDDHDIRYNDEPEINRER